MEKRVQKYVEKHKFPSQEICEEKLKKYDERIVFSRYQYVICKKIYENLWDERKVVAYGRCLHDIHGLRGLSNCCHLMNILFENSKWRVMQFYGRKLEFLFEGVTSEWQA